MFPGVQVSNLRFLLLTGIITVTSAAAMAAAPASQPSNASGLQTVKVAQNYGRLPLSTEANSVESLQYLKVLNSHAVR